MNVQARFAPLGITSSYVVAVQVLAANEWNQFLDSWLFAVRGGARTFPSGGLTLPTRELKFCFWGTFTAKNLRKIAFHLPTGGLTCSDGAIAPSSPPLAPPLFAVIKSFIMEKFLGFLFVGSISSFNI